MASVQRKLTGLSTMRAYGKTVRWKRMAFSPLCSIIKSSPNYSVRRGKIEIITIHCYVGQVTAERGLNGFMSPDRNASCNYVIGKDGDIGGCVDEAYRAWTTGGTKTVNGKKVPIRVNGISGSDQDHSAVTIEVASDTTHPYAITDKAYRALIDLCIDICKRNGIKELRWCGDKNLVGRWDLQNLTVHRWFANKACPGDYIYSRLRQLAKEVNAGLNASNKEGSDTVYNKIADMPEYMRGTIKKLVDNGVIGGTGTGAKDEDGRPADLALTSDQARLLVIVDRAHEKGVW